MKNKQKKPLDQKKLREIKVSDSLTNLEEFTRIMTDEIDFSCFDVLSITRLDADKPYTKKYAHRQVDDTTHQTIQDENRALLQGFAKYKFN